MQQPYNPYEPPPEDSSPRDGNHSPSDLQLPGYKPLGILTKVAAAGVVGQMALNVVATAMQVAGVASTAGVVTSLAGIAGLLTYVGAISFWMLTYRASNNLRAFGQQSLEFTPGSTVWWWFVPLANLWMPYQAVCELWRASEPASIKRESGTAWVSSVAPTVFLAWWATFVCGNLIGAFISLPAILGGVGGEQPTESVVGPALLIPRVVHLASAVFLVEILRQLNQRHAESAVRSR